MTERNRAHSNRFLLLYASQTGQAKAIAEEIADAAPTYGLKADLFCLSLTDKRFSIEKEACAVFVVSTTGDGEPPDTAVKFYRRLKRHTLSPNYLENLNYALLALGDSNYIKFCQFGHQLESRLKSLSAKCFFETGYGDDAFGIETGVDPWIKNLWPSLLKQLCINPMVNNPDFIKNQNILEDKSEYKGDKRASMSMFSDQLLNNVKENFSVSSLSQLIKDVDVDKCHVPKFPSPSISIGFEKAVDYESKSTFILNKSSFVSQASPPVKVTIIDLKQLTSGEDVKQTYEMTLKFEDEVVSYTPGDSFGIICCNPEDEVELLLKRLNIHHLADMHVNISLHEGCTNKRKLPNHIPPHLSLKEVFLHSVEIRSVPKKILIRILAEYTENGEEKRQLLFLSSQEGAHCYTEFVRKPFLSALDILMHFQSCKPPLERILEYFPPLKPRFYSVASSPLDDEQCFKFVFNVPKFEKADGRIKEREGVCTGWLINLSKGLFKTRLSLSDVTLSDVTHLYQMRISSLSIYSHMFPIYVYKKQNQHFMFPNNLQYPVIMIGPGTGIAPFIGFLQHREKLMKISEPDKKVGDTWLFYGCRYKEKDFLYKNELQRLLSCDVLTHLVLSFSREVYCESDSLPKYVQENIKQYADEITVAVKAGGKIFVCGDAKHMAHDVQQAFIEIFKMTLDFNADDAKSFVEKLQVEHQYVTDVWA